MLNSDSNESGKKVLFRKNKDFARAVHFFVNFYAVVLHDFSVKLTSLLIHAFRSN